MSCRTVGGRFQTITSQLIVGCRFSNAALIERKETGCCWWESRRCCFSFCLNRYRAVTDPNSRSYFCFCFFLISRCNLMDLWRVVYDFSLSLSLAHRVCNNWTRHHSHAAHHSLRQLADGHFSLHIHFNCFWCGAAFWLGGLSLSLGWCDDFCYYILLIVLMLSRLVARHDGERFRRSNGHHLQTCLYQRGTHDDSTLAPYQCNYKSLATNHE